MKILTVSLWALIGIIISMFANLWIYWDVWTLTNDWNILLQNKLECYIFFGGVLGALCGMEAWRKQ